MAIPCSSWVREQTGSTSRAKALRTSGGRTLSPTALAPITSGTFGSGAPRLSRAVSASTPTCGGGTGTQAHLHATSVADVGLSDFFASDCDPGTIVFDLDQSSQVTVHSAEVTRHASSQLSTVETNATLQIGALGSFFCRLRRCLQDGLCWQHRRRDGNGGHHRHSGAAASSPQEHGSTPDAGGSSLGEAVLRSPRRLRR